MQGMEITVKRPSTDYSTGEAVTTWESETGGDGLACPGSTSDLADAMRPNGDRIAYTLAFPKGYAGGSLRGARVVIGGEEFEVQGDPRPVPLNCPTRWNMSAEVVAVDG